MNRRDFIRRSGLSAITAWAGSSLALQGCHTEADMIGKPTWIVEGGFDTPLPIPDIAGPSVFLRAAVTRAEWSRGATTSALSYGGDLLGPTIRVPAGSTVTATLHNDLLEETNIHWHGLVLPADMDGHPADLAAPGWSLEYVLPVSQRAGTYWYHPHPHGATARQVFMGLAGMFIVTDGEEAALSLPGANHETPLIIQDKHFSGTEFDYSPSDDEIMKGYLGERVLVNGSHSPVRECAAGWHRFRILNGSTARVYNLAFTGGVPIYLIGSDGGLLQRPEQIQAILLAPGERIDVLADFSSLSPGSELYLISNRFSEYDVQGRQRFSILKIRINDDEPHAFTLPPVLSTIAALSPASAVRTRVFDIAGTISGGHGGMGRHAINGKVFDMHHADDVVAAGSTEIWEFDNTGGDEIHPMHIHGVQFQVLSRTGGRNALIPSEKGWKDTVLLMPGERVRLIMTFPSYAGLFVLHCHNLEHEDDGMMINYRIV